ncbi:MAG: hypothetical protein V4664_02440 [Patescibacteria group bacterium]
MNQKTALAIIIALFVIFGLAYYSFNSIGNSNPTNSPDVPQQVSLQGEYVCLPHKDKTGPQTMECTLGIKTDNNIYYAIDAQGEAARNVLLSLQTGLKIQIDGTLAPIEEINIETWQKYDIGGIISTSNIKRI